MFKFGCLLLVCLVLCSFVSLVVADGDFYATGDWVNGAVVTVSTVANGDLTYLFVILLFCLLDILFVVLRVPMLAMLGGLVSIAVCAVAVVNYRDYIAFSPYPELLLLLLSVVTLLSAAFNLRNR